MSIQMLFSPYLNNSNIREIRQVLVFDYCNTKK